MITARTKKQLIAFLILTLVGVTFVGARYARLDRLFYDSAYTVSPERREQRLLALEREEQRSQARSVVAVIRPSPPPALQRR